MFVRDNDISYVRPIADDRQNSLKIDTPKHLTENTSNKFSTVLPF